MISICGVNNLFSTVQIQNMYVVAQSWTSAINDDDTWHCLGVHLVRGMSVLRD